MVNGKKVRIMSPFTPNLQSALHFRSLIKRVLGMDGHGQPLATREQEMDVKAMMASKTKCDRDSRLALEEEVRLAVVSEIERQQAQTSLVPACVPMPSAEPRRCSEEVGISVIMDGQTELVRLRQDIGSISDDLRKEREGARRALEIVEQSMTRARAREDEQQAILAKERKQFTEVLEHATERSKQLDVVHDAEKLRKSNVELTNELLRYDKENQQLKRSLDAALSRCAAAVPRGGMQLPSGRDAVAAFAVTSAKKQAARVGTACQAASREVRHFQLRG